MEQFKGFFDSPLLDPKAKTTTAGIVENGIRYTVDVENGQKTGFFLDQKFTASRPLPLQGTVMSLTASHIPAHLP